MFKYQKGYIFEGHTFVVNKSDIHNAKDDSFVDGTAFLPAPDIVTNADRIRAMSDEKMAEFIMLSPEMEFSVCECCEVFRGHGAYTPCETEDGWCRAELRCNAFKKWLQQPAEDV